MKKFVFNLEKVMDFQNQKLENKKNEHAKAIAAINEQQEKINLLHKRYNLINADLNQKKSTGVLAVEILEYTSYLRVIENKIKNENTYLSELKVIENKKRNEVIEEKIESSTLEKLKEKQYAQYLKSVQKSEEVFIEEFVTRQRIVNH